MGIFTAFKRGGKALVLGAGPAHFHVADRPVKCPHCGNDTFTEGTALLNTVGMTFFELDWANRSASTLTCAQCGRIEWFRKQPKRLQ